MRVGGGMGADDNERSRRSMRGLKDGGESRKRAAGLGC